VVKLTSQQLMKHGGSEEELVAELKREAEIMREVDGHPNILKVMVGIRALPYFLLCPATVYFSHHHTFTVVYFTRTPSQ
jgi:hypothetical protein